MYSRTEGPLCLETPVLTLLTNPVEGSFCSNMQVGSLLHQAVHTTENSRSKTSQVRDAVCLVTGSAQGLGKAFAVRLLAAGAK